jgi:hypothetical protein
MGEQTFQIHAASSWNVSNAWTEVHLFLQGLRAQGTGFNLSGNVQSEALNTDLHITVHKGVTGSDPPARHCNQYQSTNGAVTKRRESPPAFQHDPLTANINTQLYTSSTETTVEWRKGCEWSGLIDFDAN